MQSPITKLGVPFELIFFVSYANMEFLSLCDLWEDNQISAFISSPFNNCPFLSPTHWSRAAQMLALLV